MRPVLFPPSSSSRIVTVMSPSSLYHRPVYPSLFPCVQLDDSLRMQSEGLDRLEGALRQTALQVKQHTGGQSDRLEDSEIIAIQCNPNGLLYSSFDDVQVEMKNEMKARRVIGKLTKPKTKVHSSPSPPLTFPPRPCGAPLQW